MTLHYIVVWVSSWQQKQSQLDEYKTTPIAYSPTVYFSTGRRDINLKPIKERHQALMEVYMLFYFIYYTHLRQLPQHLYKLQKIVYILQT